MPLFRVLAYRPVVIEREIEAESVEAAGLAMLADEMAAELYESADWEPVDDSYAVRVVSEDGDVLWEDD